MSTLETRVPSLSLRWFRLAILFVVGLDPSCHQHSAPDDRQHVLRDGGLPSPKPTPSTTNADPCRHTALCEDRASPETIAADLTATLLDGFHDNVLSKQIRLRGGGFVTPRAQCGQMREAGLFTFSFEVAPENVEGALDGVEKALQLVRTEPPNEADLNDARALYLGRYAARFNTTAGALSTLLDQFSSGSSNDSISGFEQRVLATTAADIQRFAQHYLDPATMVVAAQGNHAALDAAFTKLGRTRWLTLEQAQSEN